MSIQKTNDQFLKEVYELVGNEYEFLEEYINGKTKIKVRHNNDSCKNYEYLVRPASFLQGQRCPRCAGRAGYTPEEFKEKVYEIFGDEYTLLDEYVNLKGRLRIRHNSESCNYSVKSKEARKILEGNRCRKCMDADGGKTRRKNHDDFIKQVNNLYGDEYTVLKDYELYSEPVLIRHNSKLCDNHEFHRSPTNFLQGSACPICLKREADKSQTKTHNQYVRDVYEKHGEEYTVVGEYVGGKKPILIKHNNEECNYHVYEVNQAFRFLSDIKTCPICSVGNSSGELKIARYLKEKEVRFNKEHVFKDCRGEKPLRFDFALPDEDDMIYKVIEFHGEQHYKSVKLWGGDEGFNKRKAYDALKEEYCRNNGIDFIIIPHWSYNKIEDILELELHDKN